MLGKRAAEKAQVKNKSAAPQQITAEQLLREAVDSQRQERGPPRITFADETELNNYRLGKRKDFEESLRLKRNNVGIWLRYARWEEDQKDFRRARSIYERTLQVDYQNTAVWIRYIEMEISNKFVQHARTLYDRVTGLLPRIEQFWFKYAYMEERLENYAGARAIYEKWMSWKPTDNAWLQYVKFEERCGEIDRARAVFERYMEQYLDSTAFIRYCKFEEKQKQFEKARAGYETCISMMPDLTEEVFLKYAQFEIRRKDSDRANRIFQLGLDKLNPTDSKQLYSAYISYTKQTGSRDQIDQVLLSKRRSFYENLMISEPNNLDTCFDYIGMEEEAGDVEKIREIYERSIAKIPTLSDKKYWRRYLYLWMFYAQFEEVVGEDIGRVRHIYKTVVKLMEQVKVFSTKIFKSFAQFELRHDKNLESFRRILTLGLTATGGKKLSLGRFWVETELQLGDVAQARFAAAKLVEINSAFARNWVSFIDLELGLGEPARAVALCEAALKSLGSLDSPELVFKKWIEIETDLKDYEKIRRIFQKLIKLTNHYKAFLSYADFESDTMESRERACAILEEALEIVPDTHESERGVIREKLDQLLAGMNEIGSNDI